MRCAILVGAFLCGLGLVGCGGSPAPTNQGSSQSTGTSATATTPAAKAVSVPASTTPDQVVSVFLDALRGGDQATTAALLTTKALAETSKKNLSVCPQATPHMQYKITKAEVLPKNPSGAHVNVTWTENYSDGDGQLRSRVGAPPPAGRFARGRNGDRASARAGSGLSQF